MKLKREKAFYIYTGLALILVSLVALNFIIPANEPLYAPGINPGPTFLVILFVVGIVMLGIIGIIFLIVGLMGKHDY